MTQLESIVVRFLLISSLIPKLNHSIITKSCRTDSHTTHTTTQNPNQNVRRSCYPKCKQVQSLITVFRITNIIARVIIFIDPDIATYKPDKQETVQNGLHRPFPLLFLFVLIITLLGSLTQWNKVSEHSNSSSNYQVNRYHFFDRALVLVFRTYKKKLKCPWRQNFLFSHLVLHITQWASAKKKKKRFG